MLGVARGGDRQALHEVIRRHSLAVAHAVSRGDANDLLARLAIDPRRVAVEHNLAILKRQAFGEAIVREGDTIEIVNFVGGGTQFLILDS